MRQESETPKNMSLFRGMLRDSLLNTTADRIIERGGAVAEFDGKIGLVAAVGRTLEYSVASAPVEFFQGETVSTFDAQSDEAKFSQAYNPLNGKHFNEFTTEVENVLFAL